jgi:hypothetical protein
MLDSGDFGLVTGCVDSAASTPSTRAYSNEKSVLLRDAHRRVKNNLQIICSLLNLQSKGVDDPLASWVLRDCHNRIHSIALIHEQLYQSQDFNRIDFSAYLKGLAHALLDSYCAVVGNVDMECDLEDIRIDLDTAIPCALIVNEFISNALKHAFPGNREGKINIALRHNEDSVIVSISDNGIGLPEDFYIERTESLGMRISRMLVAQIGGQLRIESQGGALFEFDFPRAKNRDGFYD